MTAATVGTARPVTAAAEGELCGELAVRGAAPPGLDALLARSLYYDLAELALAGEDATPGVWSDGVFFPLAPA